MKNSLFTIVLLVIASLSCDSGRTIPTVETGNDKGISLTFKDTIRFHIEKYCKCYGEFNAFVVEANTMPPDSVDMEKYGQLSAQATQCFDPDGAIDAFGKSLTPERKKLKNELFLKYRQEICPEIIPKN